MEDDIGQFRAVFFEEAAERIEELETNVLNLETDASDAVVGAIFRAAHSLKGASGSFGFDTIETFTHTLEGVLERVRSRTLPVTPELVGVALRAVDTLKSLVASARDGGDPPAQVFEVTMAVAAFMDAPVGPAKADDGFELFAAPAAPEPEKAAVADVAVDVSTLRVSSAKLDQLVDLVGELVIAQSMLNEVLRSEGAGASQQVREAAGHVERSMRELQEHCMDVRMVPVAVVLGRFPRLVRDLAAASNKKRSSTRAWSSVWPTR